jgi:NAD+ synthase
MNCLEVTHQIQYWLIDRLNESGLEGFVVGVSGGIDSAVVSTLCARTGKPTILLNLPIQQEAEQFSRAAAHIEQLYESYITTVEKYTADLTHTYKALIEDLRSALPLDELAEVNTRSRLRMAALYAIANSYSSLVVGTGNKVEDFGVGFFTKYGDGGVDLSPIGDLTKTQVYEVGKYLGIRDDILQAAPTDGLWKDSRTDEEQLGDTYPDLEYAMEYCIRNELKTLSDLEEADLEEKFAIPEKTLHNYLKRHTNNAHKMRMPPVCPILYTMKE